MSNPFIFSVGRGKSGNEDFFDSGEPIFQEEDVSGEQQEDFDDEKNDETFGDTDDLAIDWQRNESDTNVMEEFKQTFAKLNSPIIAAHKEDIEDEDEPDMLSSVVNQAIGENDDTEQFFQPNNTSAEGFFLSPWSDNRTNNWAPLTSNVIQQQESDPQILTRIGELFHEPSRLDQQPEIFATTHTKASPVQALQQSPQMSQQAPNMLQLQSIPANEIEAQLLSAAMNISVLPQHAPQPQQVEKPILPSMCIISDQKMDTPPRQILQRASPSSTTPPNRLPQTFSSPEKRLGLVFNTYLLPSAQNRSGPIYGYFPIYSKMFHDAQHMSADVIEDIVRHQMTDLQISNPYIDDYYYCVQLNNHHPSKRIPENYVKWVHDSLVDGNSEQQETDRPLKEEKLQLPRILGRIPSNNIRAPRMLMELDKVELSNLTQHPLSQASLQKDALVNLQMEIENGLSQLLTVEDICLCLRLGTGENTPTLQDKLNIACNFVLKTLNLSLMAPPNSNQIVVVVSRPKGAKYVSKIFRVVPEPFSVVVIQACLLNWFDVRSALLSHDEETVQRSFYKDLCSVIDKLSMQALCSLLHYVNQYNTYSPHEKHWASTEGRRIIAVIMSRGYELNKRAKIPDWDFLFAHLFENMQRFQMFRTLSGQNCWDFLLVVAQNAGSAQKNSMFNELEIDLRAAEKTPQAKQILDILIG